MANRLTIEIANLRKEVREEVVALLELDLPNVLDLVDEPQSLWELVPVRGLVSPAATYRLKDTDRAHLLARFVVETDLRGNLSPQGVDRTALCAALFSTLEEPSPKVVVKTDVQAFYESVSHEMLVEVVKNRPDLSPTAADHVSALLRSFTQTAGARVGLPRGVALSAFLGELVLAELDQSIGRDLDVVQYFRYVDDVVVVFGAGGPKSRPQDRRRQVVSAIEELGLKANPEKSLALELPLSKSSRVRSIEYLGYRFELRSNSVTAELSEKKIRRLSTRVTRAFDAFRSSSRTDADGNQLVQRIELVTSNYRLSGRKARSYVGLAFASPLVGSTSRSVRELDRNLALEIASISSDRALIARLEPLSFSSGIDDVRFVKVSAKRIQRLSYIWRNLGEK